jgi:hypothetical protein
VFFFSFPDIVSVLSWRKREEEEDPVMGGHEIAVGPRKA